MEKQKKLQVLALYESPTMEETMAVELPDGRMMGFHTTPFRAITEEDLFPMPGYKPLGKIGREAASYFYIAFNIERI